MEGDVCVYDKTKAILARSTWTVLVSVSSSLGAGGWHPAPGEGPAPPGLCRLGPQDDPPAAPSTSGSCPGAGSPPAAFQPPCPSLALCSQMLPWALPGLETSLLLLLPDKLPAAAVTGLAAQLMLPSKDAFIRGQAAPGDILFLDKAKIRGSCFCP